MFNEAGLLSRPLLRRGKGKGDTSVYLTKVLSSDVTKVCSSVKAHDKREMSTGRLDLCAARSVFKL